MESKEQMSSWPRTYIMPTKHLPYVSEAGHRLCQGDLEIEQSAPAPETPCCFRHLVARLLPRAIQASCLILVDVFVVPGR